MASQPPSCQWDWRSWMGSPAKSRRTGLGHSSRGADAPEAAWAGAHEPAQMFWASLNSLCRNAHRDTSFCRTGRKGSGKGRERHTPTHKPKLISGVYSEITAKVLWAPLLPLAKDKGRYHLLAIIFMHHFSQGVHQAHRSENTDTKT